MRKKMPCVKLSHNIDYNGVTKSRDIDLENRVE